ncbi:hypothetical protein [Pseudomonas tohonis]|uniref:hypothetical protein n=1 Tax=Pseudomonas tohonis TaxID=2725477 RepID=UPI0022F0FD85|nr:hypothetical protein [Pseudomonas tohonis]
MHDYRPLNPHSQPHSTVLFVDTQASAEHLFETAGQRMNALCNLIALIERSEGGGPSTLDCSRLASALGLLAGDAEALYEAAHRRATAKMEVVWLERGKSPLP